MNRWYVGALTGLLFVAAACDSDDDPAGVPVAVAEIEMTPESFDLDVGDTLRVQALPLDAEGRPLMNRTIAWSSANDAVATVSTAGLVRGIAEGEVQIRAATGGRTGIATVRIVDPAAPAPAITSMTPTSVLTGTGAVTLVVRGTHFGTNAVILWGPDPVATQRPANGELRAVIPATAFADAGTVEVRVERNQVASEPWTFTIRQNAGGAPAITALEPASVPAGIAPFQLTVRGRGFAPGARVMVDGQPRETEWVTAERLHAFIPVGDVWQVGAVAVTVDNGGGVTTAPRAIAVEDSGIHTLEVEPTALTLHPGASHRLTVRLYDANGGALVGRHLSFSSSNADVAAVLADGEIRAGRTGNAQLRVQSGNTFVSVPVTVAFDPTRVETVIVSPATPAVMVGSTTQLTARTYGPGGGEIPGSPVGWESLDPSIATVGIDGRVFGVTKGRARIRATSGNAAATIEIAVREFPATADWTFDLVWLPLQFPPIVGDTTVVIDGQPVQASLLMTGAEFTLHRIAGRWSQALTLQVVADTRLLGTVKRTRMGTVTALNLGIEFQLFEDGTTAAPAGTARVTELAELRIQQKIGSAGLAEYRYVVR